MIIYKSLEDIEDRLKKTFPKETIDTLDIIVVNGKRLFSRVQLTDTLGVSVDTIKDYENKGMPRSEYSLKNFILYDLQECVNWILLNIDPRKTKRKGKATTLPEEIDENDWKTRKERADALKTEETAEIERIKKQELLKELVKADDTDKSMAELGAIFVSNYRNDLKVLPVILSEKGQEEITRELDNHYKDRIEDMDKIVNKKIATKTTVYDILYELINNENYFKISQQIITKGNATIEKIKKVLSAKN